jgi:hypothetical protein
MDVDDTALDIFFDSGEFLLEPAAPAAAYGNGADAGWRSESEDDDGQPDGDDRDLEMTSAGWLSDDDGDDGGENAVESYMHQIVNRPRRGRPKNVSASLASAIDSVLAVAAPPPPSEPAPTSIVQWDLCTNASATQKVAAHLLDVGRDCLSPTARKLSMDSGSIAVACGVVQSWVPQSMMAAQQDSLHLRLVLPA